jgi:hypothetical protein
MSKWSEVLLKNDKNFDITIKPKKEENDVNLIVEEVEDLNLKDIDEEYDLECMNNLIEIKIEFEKYIKDKCLPFLNKKEYMENPNDFNISPNENTYTLYDYIKYNSINYIELNEKINKENEEYIKELEQENNDIETSDVDN